MIMKKILVVDDDKSIRLVLSTALTRSGFLVKTSATTAGFWGLLNAEKFDVMITDVGRCTLCQCSDTPIPMRLFVTMPRVSESFRMRKVRVVAADSKHQVSRTSLQLKRAMPRRTLTTTT